MASSPYYFVAGEQVRSIRSISCLDAWMKLESHALKHPVASEFRTLMIDAYDDDGTLLESHTWQGWHEAVLKDTYGSNWQQHIEHAVSLTR